MPALWCSGAIAIPLLAAIVDFGVGDPRHWIHPVQVMGWGIQAYQTLVFRWLKAPWQQRLAGIGLGLGLPLLSGAIAGGTVWLLWQWRPGVGVLMAVVMTASCFAGRSLRDAVEDVLIPLHRNDLAEARRRLSQYVGRDTETLSASEVLRAVLETLSENATDGVLAPLFYSLVGSAIAPPLGVGAAIAYKALSTLDSMIGYQTPPYVDLGWFSARSEDVATWLPCRLTVLTIALLSGHPHRVLRLCHRDARADPSPNAGWSECAYAAALGVQLGGINTYRGQIRPKPLLGDPLRPIDVPMIRQGLRFTRWACLLWLVIGLIGLSFRYGLNCG